MTRFRKGYAGRSVLAFALCGAALTASCSGGAAGGDYELKIVMPNASNLVAGSPVVINGLNTGKVSALGTQGNQALVTVSLTGADIPLHQGTRASVEWKSLVGERDVSLTPGPADQPAIPSGSVIQAGAEQVELDQVLSALDPATRAHLTSTVEQLDATLQPHAADLNQTIKQAGPAVGAAGQILKAVGEDGPAIQSLITDLQNTISPLADRQAELQQVIGDLTNVTGSVAPQEKQLGQALQELPSTLGTAKDTLDQVPGAVDATVPLLGDLRPATQQLTSVSQNLAPLLVDLRPTVAALRPTLDAANSLLGETPSLLDTAHSVVPALNNTLQQVNPAVAFLRPYAPDLVGFASNWANAFAGYGARGHFFHGLAQVGVSSFNDNPGLPTGVTVNQAPPPGFAGGTPWTDANGSEMR